MKKVAIVTSGYLPVPATRGGGLSELIEDGVNGYLVKPNDVSAIVSVLKRTGRNELAQLGHNGYVRVL